ncbi:hypothetical protein D3C75_1375460 [compost metagenome]
MVDAVHADGVGAVVLCDIDRTTQAHLEPGTSTATATEEVDNDLIVLRVEAEAVLSFEI